MKYGTIIIRTSISKAIDLVSEYHNSLDSSGNMFVCVRNEYNQIGDVERDLFDVVYEATKQGLLYINTIIVPTEDVINVNIPDNVQYIVWLAKEKNHYFEKDAIRESHIWEKVEWGHRVKNYNPKGKDPGNVWIPTKDDGKAHITEHILFDFSAIFERIFVSSNQSGLNNLFISHNPSDAKIAEGKAEFILIEPETVTHFVGSNNKPSASRGSKLKGKVVWGTSENMSLIENGSIDVVVTSPPYWDLKDYFKKGQIGQESYQTYLDRLFKVWKGCYEKLTPNGSLWLNINVRVKDNKVILIPRDFIIQCRKIGFHYKGILIWHKSSGIPVHNKNIVDRFEYVLIFSKSPSLTLDKAFYSFKDYKNEKINGGVFWNINRKAGSVGKHFIHPAIYPNELVSRIVVATTSQNQFVLDPFLGSGTTLIASILQHRSCIGYEYNEGFKDLILSRINNEIGVLTNFDLDI